MATEQGPLFPFNEPMTALPGSLVSPRWRRWLLLLRQSVDLSQSVVRRTVLGVQGAAIAVTSLDGGALPAGDYVVSWYLSIVTPAGVSSSAQVTIAWSDDDGAKSYTAPAVTGNTTTTVQVNERVTIYSKAASPITFAVAYASNPAATMQYKLRIFLQSMGASE